MSHSRSSGSGRSGGTIRSATRFAVAAHRFANGITFGWLMTLAGTAACPAGELTMSIIDPAGSGVTDVVVTAAPADEHVAAAPAAPATATATAAAAATATAVMDQLRLAFVPRILVVAVGTSVEFPNNDSVSHQVYSFSPAKRFQLPLYKGERHPPVTFEHEGLVVLGCNIHDEMVGYIYVTGAPFFGKTDASGTLHLQNLPAGDYRVTVWSPLIADPPPALIRNVHIDTHEITADRVQLTRRLRVRPEPRPRRGDWEY